MTASADTRARVARGWGIARSIVSWVILIACLACLVGAVWWVREGQHDTGADIVGYRPYLVQTGSMAPAYDIDSFVLTHDRPADEVEVGDVIAFEADAIGRQVALHRVVSIETHDGRLTGWIVKGDNNEHPDGAVVTPDDYLGTVVVHTNATSWVIEQYHGPYGVWRVVVLPIAVILLVWFGGGYLVRSQRTVLGRTTVRVAIVFCLLASVTFSYALYLDKKQEFITGRSETYAEKYQASSPARVMKVQDSDVTGAIDIPRLDIHYPVIDYVAAYSLNIAITHFAGPALNHKGNVVLAGHHAWGNLYFTRIDQLQRGDVIWVTGADRQKVKYVVTGHEQVSPDDASVLAQPTDGKRHLTLISCTYDLRNRYIVDAVAADDLAQVPPAPNAAASAGAGILPDGALPVGGALVSIAALGLAATAVAAARRRRDDAQGDVAQTTDGL
jgi:signal peptidase I